MPAMCNPDFTGMELIHAKLIRKTTCSNGCRCDYTICGDQNPCAMEHPEYQDEQGYRRNRWSVTGGFMKDPGRRKNHRKRENSERKIMEDQWKREASLYRISGEERSFGFNIPLKRLKKVMVVMAAARISLTGSARKTANTLLDKKSGRIKMRGISRISFRRHARSRTAQHRVVKKTQALNLVKRLLLPAFYYWYRSCNLWSADLPGRSPAQAL